MYVASFGHSCLELRLKSTDVYIDIRDDAPAFESKKFGIDRKAQREYWKIEGSKAFYKEKVYAKVKKQLEKRKNARWRVFIGDEEGKLVAVIMAERLERDLIKKHNIYPTLEHITLV